MMYYLWGGQLHGGQATAGPEAAAMAAFGSQLKCPSVRADREPLSPSGVAVKVRRISLCRTYGSGKALIWGLLVSPQNNTHGLFEPT